MTSLPRSALAIVLAAYLLPLALPVPLMEDDEGLHAAIAQEMVERGDWVVPRLMGEPFLDKPVLYFWMQAASIRVFGASESAVRLPGTIMALAGALAVGWLARAMFSTAVAAWAAVCYATMLLPFAVSIAPLHDLVMVPLVTVAVGAFRHARHASSTSGLVRWSLVAGVALGLSILGKGLTGVGLVGGGVAVWLLWTRAESWRLVAVGAVAVALAALIAWPWYAAMEHAVPGYLHYFFMERHVAGVTGDTQRHAGRPFWYYAPILLAGTWPWLIYATQRARRRFTDDERLLVCWFLVDIAVLSLAGSKLATYVLPALPAVAVFAAVRVVAALTRAGTARTPMSVRAAIAVTALLPLAAVAYLKLQSPTAVPGTAMALALIPAALAGWALIGAAWTTPGKLLVVTAAALVAVVMLVRPVVAEGLTGRPLAAHFNHAGAIPPSVWVVDEGVGSLVFYLRADLRHGLRSGQIARISRFSTPDLRDRPAEGVLAVAGDRIEGLNAVIDLDGVERPPAGQFLVMPLSKLRVRESRVR